MGGEPPHACDLEKLYQAFPFEYFVPAKLVDLKSSLSPMSLRQ